jgi:hypothetical protein
LTPLRLHAGVGAFLAQCFFDDRSAYFSLGMILHQLVCRRPTSSEEFLRWASETASAIPTANGSFAIVISS